MRLALFCHLWNKSYCEKLVFGGSRPFYKSGDILYKEKALKNKTSWCRNNCQHATTVNQANQYCMLSSTVKPTHTLSTNTGWLKRMNLQNVYFRKTIFYWTPYTNYIFTSIQSIQLLKMITRTLCTNTELPLEKKDLFFVKNTIMSINSEHSYKI